MLLKVSGLSLHFLRGWGICAHVQVPIEARDVRLFSARSALSHLSSPIWFGLLPLRATEQWCDLQGAPSDLMVPSILKCDRLLSC